MTISALVVTVDPRELDATLAGLAADPRLTVGERAGNRVPVVAETATAMDGDRLYRELRDAAGVWSVDVVMVDFSGDHDDAP
jgi:hypothetical protein